jgi:hypothetical protein
MEKLLINRDFKRRKKKIEQNLFKVNKPIPFHQMSKKEQIESVRAMQED